MATVKCFKCNGTGSIKTDGFENCNGCGGSGRNAKSNSRPEICHLCNGSGRKPCPRVQRCETCFGAGTIKY